MQKSPLARAQERFKTKSDDRKEARKQAKAKLVAAVQELATDELWVARLNDDKGLARVSNKRLLHLHDVLTQVKKEVGSRAKLIDSLLQGAANRLNVEGLRAQLERESTPRLWDRYRSAKRKSARSA